MARAGKLIIDQKTFLVILVPKRAKMLPKVNFLASGGQFSSKKLTYRAQTTKLIIDHKSVLNYSYFSIAILGGRKS